MSDRSHEDRDLPAAESRWPVLAPVVVIMTLTALRPPDMRVAPRWMLPAAELLLLATVIARHPARITPHAARLRAVALCVVGIVLADTLVTTVRLVEVLIHGGKTTTSADQLLAAGGIVWSSNVIAFGLLYWMVDGGGVAARTHHMPRALDLAFPQQLNPEIAPSSWRPHFIDYLYLGLTASTAFSPTDVMPLAPWAKVAMGAQSIISMVVLGLVVARAVNVLT